MGLMSRMHEWWRRRAVGPPRVVHELAEAQAEEDMRNTKAYVLIMQKEIDRYKLDVAKVKKAGVGLHPKAGPIVQGREASREDRDK